MKGFVPVSAAELIALLRKGISDNDLEDVVTVKEMSDSILKIRIKKMGTSNIWIEMFETKQGTRFSVIQKEIAWLHRPMESRFNKSIADIIQQSGGSCSV